MNVSKTLSDSLKEVLLEGKWVSGTNIKSEISTLDWKTAMLHIHSLNSIADLVFHLDYYLEGVQKVFKGGDLTIKDQYSFDYESIKSETDWEKLKNKFTQDAESFIQSVERLSNEDLNKVFVKPEYGTYLRNIQVMIEHCYYHLGQVVLIKKLINRSEVKD